MDNTTQFLEKIASFQFLPKEESTFLFIPSLMDFDNSQKLILYGISDFFTNITEKEQVLVMDDCLSFLTQYIDGNNEYSSFLPPEDWSHENISLLMGTVFGFSSEKDKNFENFYTEGAKNDILKISNQEIFSLGEDSCKIIHYSVESKFLIVTTLRAWLHEQEVSHNEGFLLIEYLSRFLAIECLEKMESSYDFQIVLGYICRHLWYALQDTVENSLALQKDLIDALGEPSPDPDPYEDEYMDIPAAIALHYLSAAQAFMRDNGTDRLYHELYMLLNQYKKEAKELLDMSL